MFAKCFARIILQYVLEGSGSWKYNHYFPVAKGEGKTKNTFTSNAMDQNYFVKNRVYYIIFPLPVGKI